MIGSLLVGEFALWTHYSAVSKKTDISWAWLYMVHSRLFLQSGSWNPAVVFSTVSGWDYDCAEHVMLELLYTINDTQFPVIEVSGSRDWAWQTVRTTIKPKSGLIFRSKKSKRFDWFSLLCRAGEKDVLRTFHMLLMRSVPVWRKCCSSFYPPLGLALFKRQSHGMTPHCRRHYKSFKRWAVASSKSVHSTCMAPRLHQDTHMVLSCVRSYLHYQLYNFLLAMKGSPPSVLITPCETARRDILYNWY